MAGYGSFQSFFDLFRVFYFQSEPSSLRDHLILGDRDLILLANLANSRDALLLGPLSDTIFAGIRCLENVFWMITEAFKSRSRLNSK